MTEHKGQRGWHGPEPHHLTVSSGGYLTGIELDSRPGTGHKDRGRKASQRLCTSMKYCRVPDTSAGTAKKCCYSPMAASVPL